MGIDWVKFSEILVEGIVNLCTGLFIGLFGAYLGFRYALRQQATQRFEDRELREKEKRIEELTKGIDDPKSLELARQVQNILRTEYYARGGRDDLDFLGLPKIQGIHSSVFILTILIILIVLILRIVIFAR